MKLIVEKTFADVDSRIDEESRKYFIEGIFMQSDRVNQNSRMYPRLVLESATDRYVQKFVVSNRALGELGHPKTPQIVEERVSHIIRDLHFEGNDVYGRAEIIEKTPKGQIVCAWLDAGVKFGVSSRGLGSLKKRGGTSIVEKDFMITAVDIVHDPSAPEAFVNGIMEGKEWIYECGIYRCEEIAEKAKKKADKKINQKQRNKIVLEAVEKILENL